MQKPRSLAKVPPFWLTHSPLLQRCYEHLWSVFTSLCVPSCPLTQGSSLDNWAWGCMCISIGTVVGASSVRTKCPPPPRANTPSHVSIIGGRRTFADQFRRVVGIQDEWIRKAIKQLRARTTYLHKNIAKRSTPPPKKTQRRNIPGTWQLECLDILQYVYTGSTVSITKNKNRPPTGTL